jgi:hypothetical protein
VDLHQVDAIGAQQSKRRFHLADAFRITARPDLVARNASTRRPLAASSSPVVSSARPYIGELSSLAAGIEQRVDDAGKERIRRRPRRRSKPM